MLLHKYYFYIDETGQDTKGKLFIIVIVVTNTNRDQFRQFCEIIEISSMKYRDKWGATSYKRKISYIKTIIAESKFKGSLLYKVFRNTNQYDKCTIEAIVEASHYINGGDNTLQIYIDGLTKTKRHQYGAQLRKAGIRVRRIRGIMKDESEALVRLADSIAGFVRDALEEKSPLFKRLFTKAKNDKTFMEI